MTSENRGMYWVLCFIGLLNGRPITIVLFLFDRSMLTAFCNIMFSSLLQGMKHVHVNILVMNQGIKRIWKLLPSGNIEWSDMSITETHRGLTFAASTRQAGRCERTLLSTVSRNSWVTWMLICQTKGKKQDVDI